MPLYDNADAILTSGVQANSTTLFSGGRALSILSRSGPAMGMMDPASPHRGGHDDHVDYGGRQDCA